MKPSVLIALLYLFFALTAHAQQTQTVRGRLIDQDSNTPLIGATLRVIDSDPVIGAITDVDGSFRLNNVPLGRISILISYIGYETKTLPNILVTSAKEVVLEVKMQESLEKLNEIVVTAQKDKSEVLNEMAMLSARTFSVEETQRYAGSLNDPARMVASFAGVTGNAEGNNDIVVRGNSSRGILWKLEGVEIPNPNHFANEGTTGGPVNALNSNMLSNSDFYSGAFAPEYGNALSGVFDMKFKNGNNENREYTTSISGLGVDFTAEGPFSKDYQGSYLVNYRYSSLALMADLGILDFGGVPKYQDASFKINLPVNKRNQVSIFGLGGLSNIHVEEEDEDGVRTYRGDMNANLGVVGVNHVFFINSQSFLKSFVSLSGTSLEELSELPLDGDGYYKTDQTKITKGTLRAGTTFNYKFSARHKLETGVIFSGYSYSGDADQLNFETSEMEKILDERGKTASIQAFTSWKYRMSEQWTMTSGMHFLYFGLNGASTLEPRLALRYAHDPKNTFTIGGGLHSRLETVSVYLASRQDDNGRAVQPNKHLAPSKAAHLVLGYDRSLGPNTHLKVETYYQYLFSVPIDTAAGSTYSLLNESYDFVNTPLANNGTGRNYGMEFTLERFFQNGFYYMSTLSLYESLYTPQDGKERKTAFDGNYVFNLLGGKEWKVGGTSRDRTLFLNTKVALLGGARYTPIDLEASKALGTEVRKDDQPFSAKGDDVFFINLAVGTRRNKGRTTREFKLDISNITNNQATVNEYYIEATEKTEKSPQLPFLPNVVYSFKF